LSTLGTFVAVAYGLSIALGLVIGLTGGYQSPLMVLQVFSMLIPALAVLSVRRMPNGALHIDWHRLPWRYVPIALLLLPVAMHVAAVPVVRAYEGSLPWEHWLTPQADGLIHSSAERGWGLLTPGGLALRIALNAVVGLIVVSVLAFFEEIGWRGWLLPRLWARVGPRRAIVLTSAIWTVWHVPFQLSGLQHIDGMSPVALALSAPFGIFGTGLVIGWLWVRTESIWIVALAHGALNNWGEYAFKYMQFRRSPDLVVAGAGTVAVLIVGVALLTMGMGPIRRDAGSI